MGRSPSPLPVAGDRYSYIRTLSLFILCNKSQPEKYNQQARTCGVSACQSVQTSQYTQGPAKKDACSARLLLCMGEKSVCARVCVESWGLVRGVWVNL